MKLYHGLAILNLLGLLFENLILTRLFSLRLVLSAFQFKVGLVRFLVYSFGWVKCNFFNSYGANQFTIFLFLLTANNASTLDLNTRFKLNSVFSIPFILSAIGFSYASPCWVMLMAIFSLFSNFTYSWGHA